MYFEPLMLCVQKSKAPPSGHHKDPTDSSCRKFRQQSYRQNICLALPYLSLLPARAGMNLLDPSTAWQYFLCLLLVQRGQTAKALLLLSLGAATTPASPTMARDIVDTTIPGAVMTRTMRGLPRCSWACEGPLGRLVFIPSWVVKLRNIREGVFPTGFRVLHMTL